MRMMSALATLILLGSLTVLPAPGQSAAVGKYVITHAAGRELPAVVSENPSTGFKQEVTGGFVVLAADGSCTVSTDYRYTEDGRTHTSTSKSDGRYEMSGESVILIFGSDRLQATLKGDRLTVRADVELILKRN